MKDGKTQTVLNILDEIESIEATMESEEDTYDKEIAGLKEEHQKEMDKLRQKLKIKRKELKDGHNMK